MSCNRCTDVHKSQRQGKTQDSCKCGCHDQQFTSTSGGNWLVNDNSTSSNIDWFGLSTTGTYVSFDTNRINFAFPNKDDIAFNDVIDRTRRLKLASDWEIDY